MKTVFVAFVFLAVSISRGESGECPSVTTVADLDFARFAGKWCSIYETSPPRLPCLCYDVKPDASNNLNMTFLPYHVPLYGKRWDSENVAAGFQMNINFPALNGANFNIIDTDYENWALVFNCKEADPVAKTALFYSATLWSRNRTMSDETLNHIESVMDAKSIKYDTIQKMIQPEAVCDVGSTLFGPALNFFISHLG